MLDASPKDYHIRLQQWRQRQAGQKKSQNVGQYAMTLRPEEIQPQDRKRSTALNPTPVPVDPPKLSARQLVKAGVVHHKRGEYEMAVKSFQGALKAQIVHHGSDHPMVAHTLANIGAVFLKQGHLDLANEALQKSLEIKEQLRAKCESEDEKKDIAVSDVLNNLGNLAYLQGNYAQSMHFYRQNLRELRSRPVPDKDLANALHNIGRLHVVRQDWDAASSILGQCQKVEQELYGPKSPELADTLELIGYLHLINECYDNAMIAFSEALSIHQRHLGAVHENVATALVNVGMVMEGQGNLENARHTYATARDVFRRLQVPENHRGLETANRNFESLTARMHDDMQNMGEEMESAFERVAERDERETFDRQGATERRD